MFFPKIRRTKECDLTTFSSRQKMFKSDIKGLSMRRGREETKIFWKRTELSNDEESEDEDDDDDDDDDDDEAG